MSAGQTGRSGIIAAAPRPRALRSTCSCIFVLALVTASFASTASTHVVMVTAAIPAVKASNDTHAIAFAPTQITLLGMWQVGDQIYLMLLIVDAGRTGADMSVFAIRHGETEWSVNGRHTGTTDIPLTANGRRLAARLRPALSGRGFELVLVSPLQRARETCELAGLAAKAIIEPDLVEWNYGDYEGLTPKQIHERAPGWLIFRDGCPGGETPEQVAARADRVIARARAGEGDVALFAHGHVLRLLAARWLGMPARAGQHFLLDTDTLNVLDQYRGVPALRTWNAPLVGSVSAVGERRSEAMARRAADPDRNETEFRGRKTP